MYYIYYARDFDLKVLYFGCSRHEPAVRGGQHVIEYRRRKKNGEPYFKWMDSSAGFGPVKIEGSYGPFNFTRAELRLHLEREFSKYGGLQKEGGSLYNQFTPIRSDKYFESLKIDPILNSKLPNEIMNDIIFSLSTERSLPYDQFIDQVREVQREFFSPRIKDKRVALEVSSIIILYDKFDHESDIFKELYVRIHSDNNESFTNGELLYKINQHIGIDLEYEDNRFFEGLVFTQEFDNVDTEIPIYFLMTGN